MEEARLESLSLPTPMGPVKATALHFNTFLTLLVLVAVGVLAYAAWQHREDGKILQGEFIAAIKDQTAAMREGSKLQREQNCLMRFEGIERVRNAELCRTITQ